MNGTRRRRRFSRGSFLQDFISDAIDAGQETLDDYAGRDYPEKYEEHLKERAAAQNPPPPADEQEAAKALREAIEQVQSLTVAVRNLRAIVDDLLQDADEPPPPAAADAGV